MVRTMLDIITLSAGRPSSLTATVEILTCPMANFSLPGIVAC